mgnify:CR=1 FL=1
MKNDKFSGMNNQKSLVFLGVKKDGQHATLLVFCPTPMFERSGMKLETNEFSV